MAFDYQMKPLLAAHGKDYDTLGESEREFLDAVFDAGYAAGLSDGIDAAPGWV